MPISVTGRLTADRLARLRQSLAGACHQRGFTLVEMMVALLIAAILAGSLMLAVPDRSRSLRFEADRLARLMAIAREEALLRGAPVRFESNSERYRFVVWLDRAWWPLTDDPALRERVWIAPTELLLERADGQRVIEFGREHVDVPFRLTLARDGARVTIVANGLGGFMASN